jgi:hypothetical protein
MGVLRLQTGHEEGHGAKTMTVIALAPHEVRGYLDSQRQRHIFLATQATTVRQALLHDGFKPGEYRRGGLWFDWGGLPHEDAVPGFIVRIRVLGEYGTPYQLTVDHAGKERRPALERYTRALERVGYTVLPDKPRSHARQFLVVQL